MCEVEETPILMRKIENDKLIKIVEYEGRTRRQDYPEFYRFNGAIYINSVDMIFEKKVFIDDNTIPYIMKKQFSTDIDTYEDLEKAEELMKILNIN